MIGRSINVGHRLSTRLYSVYFLPAVITLRKLVVFCHSVTHSSSSTLCPTWYIISRHVHCHTLLSLIYSMPLSQLTIHALSFQRNAQVCLAQVSLHSHLLLSCSDFSLSYTFNLLYSASRGQCMCLHKDVTLYILAYVTECRLSTLCLCSYV